MGVKATFVKRAADVSASRGRARARASARVMHLGVTRQTTSFPTTA